MTINKTRKDYLDDKLLALDSWRERYVNLLREEGEESKLVNCARMMVKCAEELWIGLQTKEDKGKDWLWWD